MACVSPELRCSQPHKAHHSLSQATRCLGVPTAGSISVAACHLWRKSRSIWKRSCRYARLSHMLLDAVSNFPDWQRHVLCQYCDKFWQASPPPAALLLAMCNARGTCPLCLALDAHSAFYLCWTMHVLLHAIGAFCMNSVVTCPLLSWQTTQSAWPTTPVCMLHQSICFEHFGPDHDECRSLNLWWLQGQDCFAEREPYHEERCSSGYYGEPKLTR